MNVCKKNGGYAHAFSKQVGESYFCRWCGMSEHEASEQAEIESLRQQLAEANAKVAFLQGDGSIVGYPWDAPYSDGFEMATAKYRERIIATEEMYEAKIADLTARLEEQEVSGPVPVGYFLRGPDGYLEEVDNETSDTIRLYGTQQPTPTVQAAVAAAYRKSAEVCRKTRDALEENRKVWEENPHLTPDESYIYEWEQSACRGEEYAQDVLAIPHDDSALREICMRVADEAAKAEAKGLLQINYKNIIDSVLGEVR